MGNNERSFGKTKYIKNDFLKRMVIKEIEIFIRIKFRSSRSEVFLGKGVLKICSKFTGEHSSRSVILITLQNNFVEITIWHGCSPLKFAAYF